MKKSTAATLLLLAMTSVSHAQSAPPDPSQMAAAIQACESSSYNTSGVTLPTPTPGQPPQFSDEQHQLLQACESAGILPQHKGPHGGPPPGGGQPPADGQMPPPPSQNVGANAAN